MQSRGRLTSMVAFLWKIGGPSYLKAIGCRWGYSVVSDHPTCGRVPHGVVIHLCVILPPPLPMSSSNTKRASRPISHPRVSI